MYLCSILVCLVEVAETGDFHQVETISIYQLDVEVADDKGGKVETSHLIEQLVLVE